MQGVTGLVSEESRQEGGDIEFPLLSTDNCYSNGRRTVEKETGLGRCAAFYCSLAYAKLRATLTEKLLASAWPSVSSVISWRQGEREFTSYQCIAQSPRMKKGPNMPRKICAGSVL